MSTPTRYEDLPHDCSFDPEDWYILAQCWFPVANLGDIRESPVSATLLDQPLVIYESDGEIVVANDYCPHRGVPLSLGLRQGNGIQCKYHGLRFGPGGHCDLVPANPEMRIPDRLHLRTYPGVKRYGLVWTRLREPSEGSLRPLRQTDVPVMPFWDEPGFQKIVCPYIDIAGFAGRQVEGFLDVAHFGFVHTNTFGDPLKTRVSSYVPITTDVGFSVDYRSDVPNYPIGAKVEYPPNFEWLRHFEIHLPFTASITVHFPNGGVLVVMNAASPVSGRKTRLFAPIVRNFDHHVPVSAVHDFNRRVFEEDRAVVEAQRPQHLPLDPTLEAHIPADRSSFAYRKGLRAMGFSMYFGA